MRRFQTGEGISLGNNYITARLNGMFLGAGHPLMRLAHQRVPSTKAGHMHCVKSPLQEPCKAVKGTKKGDLRIQGRGEIQTMEFHLFTTMLYTSSSSATYALQFEPGSGRHR